MGGMFGEQICHICWVEATSSMKSKTFNKRIFVVGRFRVLIVKKGKFGRSVGAVMVYCLAILMYVCQVNNNIHLYNIVEIISNDAEEKVSWQLYRGSGF